MAPALKRSRRALQRHLLKLEDAEIRERELRPVPVEVAEEQQSQALAYRLDQQPVHPGRDAGAPIDLQLRRVRQLPQLSATQDRLRVHPAELDQGGGGGHRTTDL